MTCALWPKQGPRDRRIMDDEHAIIPRKAKTTTTPDDRHGTAGSTAGMLARRVAVLVALAIVNVAVYLANVRLTEASSTLDLTRPEVREAVTIALLTVQSGALWWRRERPVAAFVVVFVLHLLTVLSSGGRELVTPLTLWFAIYWLAYLVPHRRTAWVIGVAAGADAVFQVLWPLTGSTGVHAASIASGAVIALLKVAGSYGACGVIGLTVATLRRRSRLATEHAALVTREHEATVAAALALERNRMARELHDVAAHHLAGIIVQTKAALQAQLYGPERTTEILESIRSEGQLALESLREVVRVLRTDGDSDLPQPTLSRLPSLIESLRHVNRNITVHTEGDLDDLPPAASLACFRIIQESVTNAAKHAAGAPVQVRTIRRPHEILVEVTNGVATSGPPAEFASANSGFGLLGMRERVEMLGGTLAAQATADGGWCTRATIPLAAKRVLV